MSRHRPKRPPRRLPGGFYAIERRVLEEDMRGDAAMYLVWTTLIGWANVADGTQKVAGQRVTVRRGQVVTGIDELADEWGLGMKEVRRCLSYLQKTGRIDKRSGNQGSLITIIKFDEYQRRREKGASGRASDGQATGKRRASDGQHQNQENQGNHGTLFGSARRGSGGGTRKGQSPTALANRAFTLAAGLAVEQNERNEFSADEAETALADLWPLFRRAHPKWTVFVKAYLTELGNGYGSSYQRDQVAALRALVQGDPSLVAGPPEPETGPPDDVPPPEEPWAH